MPVRPNFREFEEHPPEADLTKIRVNLDRLHAFTAERPLVGQALRYAEKINYPIWFYDLACLLFRSSALSNQRKISIGYRLLALKTGQNPAHSG